MNQMARFPQWSGQGTTDPVRQIIDRLFEGSFLQGGSRDESSVVTSQWIPLVDIKEEHDRFILYADIPGVDPKNIEVQMDKGLLTIKGDRTSEIDETEASPASNGNTAASIAVLRSPIARTLKG